MQNMNTKDLQIIAHLRNNARMPLTTMSRKTSIPVSTLFDRLKANEKELITKHTALIDFAKLGYGIRTSIALKAEREDKEKLKQFLVNHHLVNSVYKVSNDYDFILEGIFREIKEMEQFFDDMENSFSISDKKILFITEDLKRESFLSDPRLIFG